MADATLHADDGHHDTRSFFTRWFMSTNHKDIGILYLVVSAFAGFISVAFTIYMRLELMEPGVQYMYLPWVGNMEALTGEFSEAIAALTADGATYGQAALERLQTALAATPVDAAGNFEITGGARADVVATLSELAKGGTDAQASTIYGLMNTLDGDPNGHLWNVLITGHGILMMFFVVIPGLFGGFGNYFMPLQIGAPDMAFPRMNNLSFWMYVAGTSLAVASVLSPGGNGQAGSGVGWVLYPPLSTSEGGMVDGSRNLRGARFWCLLDPWRDQHDHHLPEHACPGHDPVQGAAVQLVDLS